MKELHYSEFIANIISNIGRINLMMPMSHMKLTVTRVYTD